MHGLSSSQSGQAVFLLSTASQLQQTPSLAQVYSGLIYTLILYFPEFLGFLMAFRQTLFQLTLHFIYLESQLCVGEKQCKSTL